MDSRQENGPTAEKVRDRRSNRTRQTDKTADRKVESNDSREIPDSMATSEVPGHPSGLIWRGFEE